MADPTPIAGALFDFAGYLTTREPSLEVGAKHHPGPVLDALQAWAAERGLSLDDADVRGWQDRLPPAQRVLLEEAGAPPSLPPMLPAQAAFVADTSPVVGLVHGWAAGGSTAAVLKALALGSASDEPGLLLAPTETQRDWGLLERLREVSWKLDTEVRVSYRGGGAHHVELRLPCRPATMVLASFDALPGLLPGRPPWVVVDGAHLLTPEDGAQVLASTPRLAAVGAAEGWGSWFHRGFAPDPGVFRDDPPGPPPIRDAVLHRLRTEENHFVPPEYIAARRSQMSPKAQRVYLDAEWVRGQ